PLVPPGTYAVRAVKRIDDETTPLGDPVAFEVEAIGDPALPRQDPVAVLAFQRAVGELARAARAASEVLDEAKVQVDEIEALVKRGRTADLDLLDEARRIELALLDAEEALSGDRTKTSRGEPGSPSVRSRLRNAQSSLRTTHGPTATQREQFRIAFEEYRAAVGALRRAAEVDLEQLKDALDAAGAPWTRGRKIPTIGEDGGP
ncbi:MAG: glycosyl hydrolase, partial [Planctomycetota bacterium JB042]